MRNCLPILLIIALLCGPIPQAISGSVLNDSNAGPVASSASSTCSACIQKTCCQTAVQEGHHGRSCCQVKSQTEPQSNSSQNEATGRCCSMPVSGGADCPCCPGGCCLSGAAISFCLLADGAQLQTTDLIGSVTLPDDLLNSRSDRPEVPPPKIQFVS